MVEREEAARPAPPPPVPEGLPPAERRREQIARAVEVVRRLRAEGGCPWDRAQTHATLRPYVLEEAYEVLDALDAGDPAKLRDELGDLLFQVLLHAQLASEAGSFTIGEVAEGLSEKLIRRHPHVFADERAETPGAVLERWEELKRRERAEKGEEEPSSILAGIPHALPALARAQKVQERAARVGFDWARPEEILAKLDEECLELRQALAAGDAKAIEHEIGDVLFTVVNLARRAHASAEDALRRAVERFTRRFSHVEASVAASGKPWKEHGLEALDAFWVEAKGVVG